MYLHQKMIRIYADIDQNSTFLGRFQTFGGYFTYTTLIVQYILYSISQLLDFLHNHNVNYIIFQL